MRTHFGYPHCQRRLADLKAEIAHDTASVDSRAVARYLNCSLTHGCDSCGLCLGTIRELIDEMAISQRLS